MNRPKEDPQDKQARLRERRASEIDRKAAGESNAAALAADIRGIYGSAAPRPSFPFLRVAGK